tara:strand:+ start:151 stop:309 length:159 start_codon:yes stop_codon:yes gene_type:complete
LKNPAKVLKKTGKDWAFTRQKTLRPIKMIRKNQDYGPLIRPIGPKSGSARLM